MPCIQIEKTCKKVHWNQRTEGDWLWICDNTTT